MGVCVHSVRVCVCVCVCVLDCDDCVFVNGALRIYVSSVCLLRLLHKVSVCFVDFIDPECVCMSSAMCVSVCVCVCVCVCRWAALGI